MHRMKTTVLVTAIVVILPLLLIGLLDAGIASGRRMTWPLFYAFFSLASMIQWLYLRRSNKSAEEVADAMILYTVISVMAVLQLY